MRIKNRAPFAMIAVMVMLIAATSAFARYEMWTTWFVDGYLIYDSEYFYHPGSSFGAPLCDSTIGDADIFYFAPDAISARFYNSAEDDSLSLTIYKVDVFGSKDTGTSGTHYCTNGQWSGTVYVFSTSTEYSVWGDWNGTFVYGLFQPPHYFSGEITFEGSSPTGIDGYGESSGYCVYSSTSAPCNQCD